MIEDESKVTSGAPGAQGESAPTRQIKFRAWHSGRKQMFAPEQMGRDQLTLMPDGNGFINVSGNSTSRSSLITQMIPMQFTGMRDKTGREIYEGDIVEIWYPDVQSPKHRDAIIYREYCACFDTKFVEDFLRAETEVIGNIYENPELLMAPARRLVVESPEAT